MDGSNDENRDVSAPGDGTAGDPSPANDRNSKASEVRRVRFGRIEVPLPRDRLVRWGAGALLIIAGVLGFLPILGFWMIPLGLLFFTPDSPGLQRAVRRFEAWTRLVSLRVKQRFDRYKRTG